MKIVCDTNVLIAASLWDGPSACPLDFAKDNYISLISSKELVVEYIRVLMLSSHMISIC